MSRRIHRELETRRDGEEREVDRRRVEPHRRRRRETARVGRRQLQLEVGRVLVIGRAERAAGDARPALERVRVAVRRAVLQQQRPRKCRRGKVALLRVCRVPGERNRVADLPVQRRKTGVSMTGVGAWFEGAVVNDQLTSEASGLPATSFAPEIRP